MKLSPWVWLVVGVAIAIISLSYAYFQYVQPNQTETKYYEDNSAKLQEEEAKMPRAKQRVVDAAKKVQEIGNKWQAVVAEKTPTDRLSTGGVNLAVNAYQLTVDSKKFRNSVQRAVNTQLHAGGVKIISAPTVPDPTDDPSKIVAEFYNYPGVQFPICIFDLGQVVVTGTFEQISNHMKAYSAMPNYLAVADGLRLDGTAPILTGTYTLSILAYIRGSQVSAPVENLAASTTTGAPGGPPSFGIPGGGAFGGGRGRGGPGGPGGGFPSGGSPARPPGSGK